MIYDNSTLDVTLISKALDPYAVVVSSEWIPSKKIKELDGVEDHISAARFGLRRFFFRTTHLPPNLEDEEGKVWPYAAFLPLASYLKQIKRTGRDIVAIHFLEDTQQSITTLITPEKILSRVQQIPKTQDPRLLSEVLTPFVQKEGSAEFEVKILEEGKLALPAISSPFLPLDDHNAGEAMVHILKISAVLILLASIALAADSFRIGTQNAALSTRLTTIRQQKMQVEQQIAAISTKIKNEGFAKYLEGEKKILEFLEQLPETCSIKSFEPKTRRIDLNYECLKNIPQNYKNRIEIDPSKKIVSVSIP